MTAPQSNGLRAGAIVLIVLGGLILLCGVAYMAAYYVTSGFFDAGPAQLADLGPGNLGIAGSGLCCGAVLAVVGVIMLARARRR